MKKLHIKDLKKILENINNDIIIVCVGDEGNYLPAFLYQENDKLYLDYRPPDEDCLYCKSLLTCDKKDNCNAWNCADFEETRKILYEGY